MNHLRSAFGSHRFMASVEVENQRSARLLQALGFRVDAGPLRQTHGLSASERLYLRDDVPA
jgi:RimJ/RimL family protein N-acetyltransferase